MPIIARLSVTLLLSLLATTASAGLTDKAQKMITEAVNSKANPDGLLVDCDVEGMIRSGPAGRARNVFGNCHFRNTDSAVSYSRLMRATIKQPYNDRRYQIFRLELAEVLDESVWKRVVWH